MKNIKKPARGLIPVAIGFIFVLFVSASTLFAVELPALTLDEGANRVGLTLCNRSDSDLSAVSASIDKAKLPAWLSIQCEPRAVQVPQGAQARDKLFIVFTVKDDPAGAETLVALGLKDAIGNAWNYTITVKANSAKPLADALIGNYPNPFNPDTMISYSLSTNKNASLVVFNALGQKVRTSVEGSKAAGKYTVRWDGKDGMGRQVSSGVYYYRLEIGKFVQTKKIVMVE